MTTSRMVAPNTELVTIHRTTQHATMMAATVHRRRLRRGIGGRAGRRIASPCSVIDYLPRSGCFDLVPGRLRHARPPGPARILDRPLRQSRMGATSGPVNESGPASRHLEIPAQPARGELNGRSAPSHSGYPGAWAGAGGRGVGAGAGGRGVGA